MSGEPDSKQSSKDLVDKWDKVLDEYESKLGLENHQEIAEDGRNHLKEYRDMPLIKEYLEMSREMVEALSPNEALGIAFSLERYALYIQRAQNREIARVNFVTSYMEEVIASEINNYNGYGWKEKSLQAIKGNIFAEKLDKIRRYAQMRVDRLNFVASSIKNLANILKVKQWKD